MEIIEITLEGLGTVFTTYVPMFVNLIIDVASNLFVKAGETPAGTIVLGIVVLVAGVAIVTSAFRVILRMLRIKRHA